MNRASVLIDVVKTINTVMDNKRELLFSYPTMEKFRETAILIEGFTELRDHFQDQIEAVISAYEQSQGM